MNFFKKWSRFFQSISSIR